MSEQIALIIENEWKKCSKCLKEKPVTQFYMRWYKRDGERYQVPANECKDCRHLWSHSYYRKHTEQAKISSAKWVIAHPKERREASKRSYRKHREAKLAYGKKYDKDHPEIAWGRHIKRKYGITLAEYNSMLSSQGGVCRLCGRPPGKHRLHTDHNHDTGQVRALLCHSCNIAIGCMKEDQDILAAAIEYLNEFKKSSPCVAVLSGKGAD